MNRKLEKEIHEIIVLGVDRNKYPEGRKGSIAKKHWNDPVFTLGMEYGYILALLNKSKKKWYKFWVKDE